MARHVLEREQFLPITLTQAWYLFSDPRDLARITPPSLGFLIHEPISDKMYAGQRITYTVRPLFGIPLTWVTLIKDVDVPYSFTDTQLKGPYKLWHQRHTFHVVEGGILMKDRLEYELPLGPMGEVVHKMVVRQRVEHIFHYRYEVLERMFPTH
jgi:ligand-binding SRPBCC domain-containing protein